MAFDASIYGQLRPDLLTNWQRAHDPAYLAANPNDPNVHAIASYPSLEAYLQADYGGNPAANDQAIASYQAAHQPAPTTTTPPPATTTPPPTTSAPPPATSTPSTPTLTPYQTPPDVPTNTTPQTGANGPSTYTPPNITINIPGLGSYNPATGQVGTGGNGNPTTTANGVDSRNLTGEGAQTLQAYAQLFPQLFGLYQQYAPQQAQTDLNTLKQQLFGNVDVGQFLTAHPEFRQGYEQALSSGGAGNAQNWLNSAVFSSSYIDPSTIPGSSGMLGLNRALTDVANQQTIDSNRLLRNANLQDVYSFAPQALQAQQQLNPQLYQGMSAVDASAQAGLPTNPFVAQLGSTYGAGPSYQSVGYSPTTGALYQPNVSAQQVNPTTAYTPVQSASSDFGLGSASGMLGNTGASSLNNSLVQQAQDQLALGTSLDPTDVRQAQQAAREAWAARGLVNSNGAVADEVLNQYNLGQQRLQQRQQFAQGVNSSDLAQRNQAFQNALGLSDAARGYAGLGLSAQQSNLGAQLQGNQEGLQGQLANQDSSLRAALANQQLGYNTSALNLANQQQNSAGALQAALANQGAYQTAYNQNNSLGLQLAGLGQTTAQQNFANLLQAANLRASTAFNPFSVLGNSTNTGSNSSLFGQGAANSSGQLGNQSVLNMANPFSSYASDLYSTNYNGALASQISAANNNAAKQGGIFGALGSLGGALISGGTGAGSVLGSLGGLFCWVSREVYGENNPRWLKFRSWMLWKAPQWLFEAYAKRGASFARHIANKPKLKAAIQEWMEAQLTEWEAETLNMEAA